MKKAWTKEEEEKFIWLISIRRGDYYWKRGQKKLVWAAIGKELDRTHASLSTKYAELLRKGKVTEDE